MRTVLSAVVVQPLLVARSLASVCVQWCRQGSLWLTDRVRLVVDTIILTNPVSLGIPMNSQWPVIACIRPLGQKKKRLRGGKSVSVLLLRSRLMRTRGRRTSRKVCKMRWIGLRCRRSVRVSRNRG